MCPSLRLRMTCLGNVPSYARHAVGYLRWAISRRIFSVVPLVITLTVVSCTHERAKPNKAEIKIEETKWPNRELWKSRQYYEDGERGKVSHGLVEEWYENGKRWRQSSYSHGKLDGLQTTWYKNGVKEYEGTWHDNVESGRWTAWQRTGEKDWECVYRDGEIVGKKKFWKEDVLIRTEEYSGSRILLTVYHMNGHKRLEGTLDSENRRVGKWVHWETDGTKIAEGEWKKGTPWNGRCSVPMAGDAGSWAGIERFETYRNGKKISE